MQDSPGIFDSTLSDLDWTAWLERLDTLTETLGYAQPLGAHHAAVLVEQKPVLLVSFETHQGITQRSSKAQPLGWSMAQALGWSHLCMVSDGATWFRDPAVYTYFDQLVDDGFFEEFETVIFYGAASCGYAAAAFSVAAPGARVLVLGPQATLDPRVTEWDDRFLHMRRTAFDDRYGYAPDMLDAAAEAIVLYDPEVDADAMHAALFTRPNVTRFRMRHTGDDLEELLLRMNILLRALALLSAGRLDRQRLSQLWRARRREGAYQFKLLEHLEARERHGLVLHLCDMVLTQRDTRPFRKARTRARRALETEPGSQTAVGIGVEA